MDLTDDNLLELLDWQPDAPGWRDEWMAVYDRAPAGSWRKPTAEWIDWARGVLQQPVDMDGCVATARILAVAEVLHPQGLDRRRLQDALLALGRLHGRDYQPAQHRVDMFEQNGILRFARMDLWHPGMASGSGWRTFCRLTLYGKSLVQTETMPEPFPPREPEPRRTALPWERPVDWLERARAGVSDEPAMPPADAAGRKPACTIPDDFSWAGPFVEQQVRKFFRRHWGDYTEAVQAVVNGQMRMPTFSLDFGPKRISGWINGILKVRSDHPNPCSKQNINDSATYTALVKDFKANPRDHAIVQRLQHGRSDEAQAILDEFLDGEGLAP